jgi:tripeptidyl-peptidase-1
MKGFASLLALCVLGVAAAIPAMPAEYATTFQVHEEVRHPVGGWRRVQRSDPARLLEMHVFVRQRNLDLLERVLYSVSDPASPSYGRHLSFEDTNALVAPDARDVAEVVAWLVRAGGIKPGAIESTPNGDMLRFVAPVAVAERLLDTEYATFEHAETGERVERVERYSLPARIRRLVDFVGPTVRLPRGGALPRVRSDADKPSTASVARKHGASAGADAPQETVTPSVLAKLYNLSDYTNQNANNSFAVTGFLAQFISLQDLSSFFQKLDPSQAGRKVTIVGPNVEGDPGVEASLDIQYGMAMARGVQSNTFWSTPGEQPGNPGNEPFLVWLYALGNTSEVPLLFSISYGDNENSVLPDYIQRVNAEFQKAGVRGITLMAASGDGGVGGSQPTGCIKFIPVFPAASPFITAVGGTTGTSPEVAAGFSSGGFSDVWARPSYQESFVQQYLSVAKNLPPKSLWNQTGAGFPDIAAQAENFQVMVGGFLQSVDGTSCASPTAAGLFALLNDVRLSSGKAPLGWLNPLVYAHPEAFNDVTMGSNPGCESSGFQAAEGWDPVTGLGTPDFGKWKAIVESLP